MNEAINENEVLQGHPGNVGFEMETPDEPEVEDHDAAGLPEDEVAALEAKIHQEAELDDQLDVLRSEDAWNRKVAESTRVIGEKYREIEREKLQRVEDLDSDAEDYDDQIADILTDAELARKALDRQYPEITAPPPSPEEDPALTHRRAVRRAQAHLETEAWRAGIDPSDVAFKRICRETPVEGDFESQVRSAIQRYHETHRKAEKPTEQTISSIDDVLQENESGRRLTWGDLQQGR